MDTANTTETGSARPGGPGPDQPSPRTVDTLPVSECFGLTIQGEGPAAGRLAAFVRLMGCNLSCGWGVAPGTDAMRCDTGFTWDGDRYDLRAETTHMTAADIIDRLTALAGDRRPIVVISGGEPLLQQQRPAFARLLERVGAGRRGHPGLGWPVHIETNGTIAPQPFLLARAAAIAVSPKLPHAGPHRGHQDPALHPRWGEVLRCDGDDLPDVYLKVVVRNAQDVALVAARADIGWAVPRHRVWVMPEGTTAAALNYRWPEILEAAIEHGLHATHRLHVLAWGDERGK